MQHRQALGLETVVPGPSGEPGDSLASSSPQSSAGQASSLRALEEAVKQLKRSSPGSTQLSEVVNLITCISDATRRCYDDTEDTTTKVHQSKQVIQLVITSKVWSHFLDHLVTHAVACARQLRDMRKWPVAHRQKSPAMQDLMDLLGAADQLLQVIDTAKQNILAEGESWAPDELNNAKMALVIPSVRASVQLLAMFGVVEVGLASQVKSRRLEALQQQHQAGKKPPASAPVRILPPSSNITELWEPWQTARLVATSASLVVSGMVGPGRCVVYWLLDLPEHVTVTLLDKLSEMLMTVDAKLGNGPEAPGIIQRLTPIHTSMATPLETFPHPNLTRSQAYLHWATSYALQVMQCCSCGGAEGGSSSSSTTTIKDAWLAGLPESLWDIPEVALHFTTQSEAWAALRLTVGPVLRMLWMKEGQEADQAGVLPSPLLLDLTLVFLQTCATPPDTSSSSAHAAAQLAVLVMPELVRIASSAIPSHRMSAQSKTSAIENKADSLQIGSSKGSSSSSSHELQATAKALCVLELQDLVQIMPLAVGLLEAVAKAEEGLADSKNCKAVTSDDVESWQNACTRALQFLADNCSHWLGTSPEAAPGVFSLRLVCCLEALLRWSARHCVIVTHYVLRLLVVQLQGLPASVWLDASGQPDRALLGVMASVRKVLVVQQGLLSSSWRARQDEVAQQAQQRRGDQSEAYVDRAYAQLFLGLIHDANMGDFTSLGDAMPSAAAMAYHLHFNVLQENTQYAARIANNYLSFVLGSAPAPAPQAPPAKAPAAPPKEAAAAATPACSLLPQQPIAGADQSLAPTPSPAVGICSIPAPGPALVALYLAAQLLQPLLDSCQLLLQLFPREYCADDAGIALCHGRQSERLKCMTLDVGLVLRFYMKAVGLLSTTGSSLHNNCQQQLHRHHQQQQQQQQGSASHRRSKLCQYDPQSYHQVLSDVVLWPDIAPLITAILHYLTVIAGTNMSLPLSAACITALEQLLGQLLSSQAAAPEVGVIFSVTQGIHTQVEALKAASPRLPLGRLKTLLQKTSESFTAGSSAAGDQPAAGAVPGVGPASRCHVQHGHGRGFDSVLGQLRLLPPLDRLGCCNPLCTGLEGPGEVGVKLRACGGCRAVHYCSKECITQCWPGHKGACKQAQAAAGAAAAAAAVAAMSIDR